MKHHTILTRMSLILITSFYFYCLSRIF